MAAEHIAAKADTIIEVLGNIIRMLDLSANRMVAIADKIDEIPHNIDAWALQARQSAAERLSGRPETNDAAGVTPDQKRERDSLAKSEPAIEFPEAVRWCVGIVWLGSIVWLLF